MQSLNNTTASTPAKAQMQDIASNHRGNQLNLRQYKDLKKKKVYDEVVDARDITIECRDNDSQDIICVTSWRILWLCVKALNGPLSFLKVSTQCL